MTSDVICSFCRMEAQHVLAIVAAPDGAAAICDECVQVCVQAIAARSPEWLEKHRRFVGELGSSGGFQRE
ncbi:MULTISPECIES: ClpX C4-type zinc finger protein [Bradyrhizobium]|uniref:ClpX C4-type zinc finger protein n=1 Tax=Bradyrhizobium barranii subsp. barranii TaxID=2823807 RepID=A0A939M0K9_9BRAD|nr:hypothetical protein [Bradyrhizobium liaoningense]MBR1004951.1 hypothetical protein [Bradyrhizobium liaoningense]MBR1071407.1 hypothetical protein [Bradyrhizobium liaoningense]UEM13834.1 ClpX C4-type zinc finger protein [Bradyrhizobium barranii subsp. barranii]